MVPIGIWLGTLGYTVFYYGERLFVQVPVSFAAALGLKPEEKHQQLPKKKGG